MSPGNPRGDDSPPGWPAVVWTAPVLRGLDARAQREIEAAGRLVDLAEHEVVYREGHDGGVFFVVAQGSVALAAAFRGEDVETRRKIVSSGDSFGEESAVGLARRATARALCASTVAEVPVHVFQRAAARSGKAELAERLLRSLQRAATTDLLEAMPLARHLDTRDRGVLLDAITHRRVARGEHVYRQGDDASSLFLIAEGMVQLQVEEEGRLHVRAYLSRGDFFGDDELESGGVRRSSALASGPGHLLVVPGPVVRELAARHPDLLPSLRRVARDQEAAQRAVVAPAVANATQHVFRDLYRLRIARSLLVIDLETCVRCGHCAWACADTYGTARLVRRGDKLVARVDLPGGRPASTEGRDADEAPQHLLLPNSCQHCENPACMVDCPTGAIGRDPSGEVFIREELCTGCGACAKACPWDNIQMASRSEGAPRPSGGAFPEVAVKCDLCRGYEGPACVQACPTGAIFRVDPNEAFADLRALVRRAPAAGSERTGSRAAPIVGGAALAALGIAVPGVVLQRRGASQPGRGVGLAAGALAGAGMIALLLYAVPKRGVRRWMRPRTKTSERLRWGRPANPRPGRPVATSVTRPHLEAHLAIGVATVGLALAHAGARVGAGPGGALLLALVATSIAGAILALAYRLVPKRLARIERTAALPEDFGRARQELVERLYRDASGKSDLVKKILERILLPYATRTFGALALIASSRGLREEEAAVRARIDAALEGRGKERLAGLAELVRLAVELRALAAQRVLSVVLRVGLPVHVISFAIALALLAVHVASALLGRS